jgi:hypothetical protein
MTMMFVIPKLRIVRPIAAHGSETLHGPIKVHNLSWTSSGRSPKLFKTFFFTVTRNAIG